MRCTSNKSNQNQNSEFELSNKIRVQSTSYKTIVNNQMDSLKDFPPNNENIINKNLENVEIGESSCSQNSINDYFLAKNELPEFSDSRIRLNKIIGCMKNASIAKLNKSDASIPHTDFTTQIFDENIKHKNGPVIHKDMLNGINLDDIDIDVDFLKNVIDNINRASCVEPIQPPPLPTSDLMDKGASRINLISSTELNASKVTHDNIILSKSSTDIRVQLNTEVNKLHKTGPSNETKPKFVSALKPGTSIGLKNSKVVRSSLHTESLRPVIKSNEKSTEVKRSLADISVPRDPRIRHKTVLTSGKNVNPPASLISNAKYTFSANTQNSFPLNRDNSNAKLFDTGAQKIYNGQNSLNHTNIQLLNPQFSSEQNGNSIQLKNRSLSLNQNKHNRSDDKKNDYSQFSNSTQKHVNTSRIERLTKYCDPLPYKAHSYDASKRDRRKLKSVKITVYPNYKEYREDKFREQIKGYVKNKNQMKQHHNQYRSLVNEKMEKSNIIDSSYNTFGPLNETANIKKFKIPKIKHNKELNDNSTERNSKLKTFGDDKNDTDVLTTEKKSKIHLKADRIREQYLVNGQEPETNKSKNLKKDLQITDKIIDSHMDKISEIEITKNSSTDEDLRIKTIMMNNKSEKDSCPEINLEDIAVDIPSKVNKEELDSKSEQNSILINPTGQSKPKKHKKCSKEEEFKRIIKNAAESVIYNVGDTRRRTRSSVMKIEGIINTIKVNNSKPKFEKNNTTNNYKKLESGECSKNHDNRSIPNLGDVSGRTEIGNKFISSTQSGVANATTTVMVCKSQEKNVVSFNEINSTADNSSKIDEKPLIDIVKSPKFMTEISIFQDEDKMVKLNKLLESSDVNTNNEELKKKGILNKQQIVIDERIMIKRKMNKNVMEESKNEYLNDISDNNLNQAENIVKTKKKNSHLNEVYEGNTSSGNVNGHSSTDQHIKLKSMKLKKSKKNYGNFEILKNKCKPELRDFKIVIDKFDKNIQRSDNCNSDISSTSNVIQINNKPINVEIIQERKSKKSSLGPLSVKLARKKMEMENNNPQSECDIKNPSEFETKKVRKASKSIDRLYKKRKLNSENLNSVKTEEPIVLIQNLQNPKPFDDETNSNKSIEQNSNTSTFIVNKPEKKKTGPSELDKLHADIKYMFGSEALLNTSNIRQRRTNKQINYVNAKVAMSKNKKTSNIESLDSNDDQNEYDSSVGKTYNIKKIKRLTTKLNTKNKFVKNSMINKTLPPVVVKTAVFNKISNKKQDKVKKTNKNFMKDTDLNSLQSSTSMSLAIDNELIMIDDVNQNDMQQTLKIDRVWSESNNKEKMPRVLSNDDNIVIDDIDADEDDDDLSEKEELNEGPTKRICLAFEESIKARRHVKLHGPDRFICSLCNFKVPSKRAIAYHMRISHKFIHLNFVPESPNLTDFKKDNFIVFEDKTIEQKKLKMNSLFACSKCLFKANTRKIIISHLKAVHNAEQNVDCEDNLFKITPELPNYTNNSVNSLMPQRNEQQNANLKRKRSTNFGNQKGSPKAKPIVKNQSKILYFSPDTIDSIPKYHIFSDPISCLLCTYSTKVRSNLVIHLNAHTKGQNNTTKEIVNPVPSIGTCELMLDKMMNLSANAFDARNTEKIKREELDKKIVEVAPDDSLNTEVYPQFIPKKMRYKCSVARCTYTSVTEDMLKKHTSILHPNYECYICPHCQPPCIISKLVELNQIEFHLMHHGANLYRCQYCEYIDFNRVEMRTHMRNTHLSEITSSVQSNIIVIRQTMFEDDSIDKGRSKAPSYVPQWVCNICSNGLIYTENEITSHVFMAHKVSNMFKCPMCPFEHEEDDANVFELHYKWQHPSVAAKFLRVFEKISDKEDVHKQSKHLGGTENMLKQQALESIEPTLVPPNCRGIPLESTKLKTYTNKSCGIAKSPKSATKSSPIHSRKQKTFIDVFNNNDNLGAISSDGYFVCPKCCVFETLYIKVFREHLCKEVNYKTFKCLICFEISDSAKKMAWHVKKHGIGSKYEKSEHGEKLKWVDRVIGHQQMLLTELNKNKKAKHVKRVQSSKPIIVNSFIRTSYSSTKKKKIEREKKAFISQPTPDPVSNDDIINLVDDSDDE